jgi:hypothetical protein
MIDKKVPAKEIIELLKLEIKNYGLEFAKSKKDFNSSKSTFDKLIDIPTISTLNKKASLSVWGTYDMERKSSENIKKVLSILNCSYCTNTLYYTKGSFIEWHTNDDDPGERTYILYTNSPGIFRYKDTKTGKIVDDYDYVGWTQRTFLVDPLTPLWHCVYSPSPRFAYGFNKIIK